MMNGDPQSKHMMLLNRRTAQSFEDVLADISETFKLPIRRLCTADGKKVKYVINLKLIDWLIDW